VKGRPIAGFGEHAVRDDDVIVNVQVEASTETLRKADGAAAGSRDAPESGLLALPMEHLAHEDAADGRQRPVVLGKKQP
jgi:hypothetical protein